MQVDLRERLRMRSRAAARRRFWAEHDRDEYECPGCGSDGPFEVHHRDGDWLNNHPLNLIGVCHGCHADEHRRRATMRNLNAWKDSAENLLGVR